MKRFVIVTLTLVIIVLLLRNAAVLGVVIKTATGLFGESFKAVTEVGDFK